LTTIAPLPVLELAVTPVTAGGAAAGAAAYAVAVADITEEVWLVMFVKV